MEPHETHRRRPRAAAPRRNAAGQDRGAARRDQAHASIGPLILPSANCRLYYRLMSNGVVACRAVDNYLVGRAITGGPNAKVKRYLFDVCAAQIVDRDGVGPTKRIELNGLDAI